MLSLTLLSITRNTSIAVQKQLKEIFGEMVDIKSYVLDELPQNSKISDDLVVVTSNNIKDNAVKYIEPGTETIFADRVINIEAVSKLYEIPENSDVLVVNKFHNTTLEAIDQLTKSGITHLQFYPYYPGVKKWNNNCKYAVVVGEKQLIPSGNLKVIDIGIRLVDITTCINISMKLNIYDDIKPTLTSSFFRPSLKLLYQYAIEYNKNLFLTNKLQQLLNMFKSGIILLDQNNNILFYNSIAIQQIDIKDNSSEYIEKIIAKSKIYGQDFFLTINEKNLHIEINDNNYKEKIGTIITIEDINNIERIEKEYRLSLHKRGLTAEYSFKDIMHKSYAMEQVVFKAQQFAKSKSTILIIGESGTGKELLAQAIHNASDRSNEAFVAVNLASLSESLCESELFGYEEGAFTGAKKGGKQGLFALAHKGTIFLDEIGDASLDIQKKILRVIQERQILPVGGSQLIPIDIRIIAATNRDLQAMVEEEKFRRDLYYRINVLPLNIPPLRERTDDIFPLFISILQDQFHINIDVKQFPNNLKLLIESYKWPGNVRELRNIAEYVSNFKQFDLNWENDLYNIIRDRINKTISSNNTEFKAIINDLEEHGPIMTFIEILDLLNSSPFKWNRKSISTELGKTNKSISESRVKRYLLILEKSGLINCKTGSGTYINGMGRSLLNYYKQFSLRKE